MDLFITYIYIWYIYRQYISLDNVVFSHYPRYPFKQKQIKINFSHYMYRNNPEIIPHFVHTL